MVGHVLGLLYVDLLYVVCKDLNILRSSFVTTIWKPIKKNPVVKIVKSDN